MAYQLEFADDYPQVIPDPPQAHAQFSVKWKCVNTGDEQSPEVGVQVEFSDANGPILTSIGRSVVPLLPKQTDEDTVGVGAVGPGSGILTVTIDGETATIPVAIS